jgi:serine/threonine protein kinase
MTVTEYLCKVRHDGDLSTPRRLELLRHVYIPIVGALAHLHKKGVIHGDLNPSNIILTIRYLAAILMAMMLHLNILPCGSSTWVEICWQAM